MNEIEQLKDLRAHCQDMAKENPDPWEKDVQAIDKGIKALKVMDDALKAGYEGKEVEFYIGGRKFAIRELAQ